ncbi:MAG: N-acetylmuramoyl-L-alanine amidase [Alphaproteobacteria bacterium]|nr:N-acetylmuramoyl-L-alanine amidase [Alphaproteobacteria bacterium]
MMRRFFFLFFITLGIGLATVAQAAELSILDIRYGTQADKTRIVIDVSDPTDFRAFLLDGPPRLVIDMPPARLRAAKTRLLTRPLIRSYRSGVLDDSGLTRLVFDLKDTAIIDKAFALPGTKSALDRIVIDMQPASKNLFTGSLKHIHGNKNLDKIHKGTSAPAPISGLEEMRHMDLNTIALPTRKPTAQTKTQKTKYTVVIDAGHGGGDPGAVQGRIREKHITLAIAKELRRQLLETGRYDVVLTRDRDTYIKLRKRMEIARKKEGDVFLSLHADKMPKKHVRGASVYTLSETASDKETARLAEGENNAGVVAGVDLAVESHDVAGILLDLAMREKMNESNLLAKMVVEAMRDKKIRMLPNSHRSAGFAVLKAPDVPSILIESGFLSNPQDAKLLSAPHFQERLSTAIVNGLDAYFRKMQVLKKDHR